MITGHLIVIGAMKAATSTLFDALRRHPNLVAGSRKELRYFNGDDYRGPGGYDALFPDPPPDRDVLTLDATPLYSKTQRWPETPGRIASLTRPVHLVYILRDPVARAVSHVRHNVLRGRKTTEGMGRIHLPNYVDPSLYSACVAAYEAAGLGDRLLLLDFEAVCRDLEGTVAAVCARAGLPPVAVPGPLHRNTSASLPSEADANIDLAALREALAGEGARMLARGFEPARRWSV